MLKTLLLINKVTCRIDNEISLVVICCVSALSARVIPLEITGCESALLHARAHTNYFTRELNVTVKICTLGSNVAVTLTGSLV